MAEPLSFNELWELAVAANKAANGIYYHPCCDVWTTRGSVAKRSSHLKKLQWRKLISTLDKSCEDKKQALLAKMIEEGWRVPAVLNKLCECHLRQSVDQSRHFKTHNPDQRPEELVSALPSQDFIEPSYHHFAFQDQGTHYAY